MKTPLPFKTEGRLSIVVPVFNEAPHLEANLRLLVSEVEPYVGNFEVIVVSDGSTDQTNEILATRFANRFKVVVLERNQGKGAAVRRGFELCTGEWILFIDGGMELHPKEIRIFLGLRALYDADIVVGSKRHPQSQIAYPWYRRFLSGSYQLIIRWIFDLDITDTQVGIKLFSSDVIRSIKDKLSIDRYGFDLEMLVLAKRHGFTKMLEAPIRLDYFERSQRQGLRELVHIVRVAFDVAVDTMRVYRRHCLGNKP